MKYIVHYQLIITFNTILYNTFVRNYELKFALMKYMLPIDNYINTLQYFRTKLRIKIRMKNIHATI